MHLAAEAADRRSGTVRVMGAGQCCESQVQSVDYQ